MKIYHIIFFILISQCIICQGLTIRDSDAKESIVGAEIIDCRTLQNIAISNLEGVIQIDLNKLSGREMRIQAHGYLSKLIQINFDSVQLIELKTMSTAMTLGSDGMRNFIEPYKNLVENSCPNELEEINGLWKSIVHTKNGIIALFEISFISDTVITIQNNSGLSKTFSKFTYEVINETIILNEIEQYTVDTNIGFVKSHFLMRNVKSNIPLCIFRNKCESENALTIYPKLELFSPEESIKWQDITQSELYKNSKQIVTNY